MNRIICNDCGGIGWGPMLVEELWNKIAPENHDWFFLCQPCMEKRLDRTLERGELRDCKMNYAHPLYENHGIY